MKDSSIFLICLFLWGQYASNRITADGEGVNLSLLNRLKGHGNEADFLGFLQKLVLMDPLHYLSSRSAFGFEFAEIFVIEKRLPDSRVGESATPRLG